MQPRRRHLRAGHVPDTRGGGGMHEHGRGLTSSGCCLEPQNFTQTAWGDGGGRESEAVGAVFGNNQDMVPWAPHAL